MVQAYSSTLIKTRSEKEKVRKHIEVYLGHDDIRGAEFAVSEIIVNAVDEAAEGHADTIKITVAEDNTVTVEDNGWGVPMAYNEAEKKFNWELIFCTLFASGKYDNEGYKGAVLGKHGVGCSATQFASERMRVTSYQNNEKHQITFEKGEVVEEYKLTKLEGDEVGKRGTVIEFKLDNEVFSETNIGFDYFVNAARYAAMFLPNLTVYLNYKNEPALKMQFDSPAIYLDYIKKKPMTSIAVGVRKETGRDKNGTDMYEAKAGVALMFDEENHLSEIYHNRNLMTSRGITEDALMKAMVNFFNSEAKSAGLFKKNDTFSFSDIYGHLIFVGWTEARGSVSKYAYQNKTAISNTFIGELFERQILATLEELKMNQVDAFKNVLRKVVQEKNAREAGDIAKSKAIKNLSKSNEDILSMDEKLIPCRSNDASITEIYLAEGDSAMGACKQARNPEFQAIYSLGGKPINCEKKDLKQVLENKKIQGIAKALGCGIDIKIKGKNNKNIPAFDYDKLRYNKIVIATDADDDGKHIRCLTLTYLFRYARKLIENGHVYIVESPLFEVRTKNRSYFVYSDQEKDQLIRTLNEKYEVFRSKGLGENTTEMMKETTMDPATRKLIQVRLCDAEMAEQAMSTLMGEDIESRKIVIEALFDKYVAADTD